MRLFAGLVVTLVCISSICRAQTAPAIGLRDNTPAVHAFINARIVQDPQRIIESGTVVVRNGVIESVGRNIPPPSDAVVHDLSGKTVYAGFIDLYTHIGMPHGVRSDGSGSVQSALQQVSAQVRASLAAQGQASDSPQGPIHWNPQVRSYIDAAAVFTPDNQTAASLRSQGFTLALTHPPLGIFRGAGALVSLGETDANRTVIRENVAQSISFRRSGELGVGYPTSLMGSIALIRQIFSDAGWHGEAHESYERNPVGQVRPETNLALTALYDAVAGRQPVLIETSDEQNLLRAAEIAREYALKLWIRGSGYEYQRIDAVTGSGVALILPLNFPDPPDVERPEDGRRIPLSDLLHWDTAPDNPARVANAGLEFALTTSGMKDTKQFLANLRRAVARGLRASAALAALTTVPARMAGVQNRYGTIDTGKSAHLIITDGDLFALRTRISEVWIDGNRYAVDPVPSNDVRGKWTITSSAFAEKADLFISGELNRLSGTWKTGDQEINLASVKLDSERISIVLPGDSLGINGAIRLSAPAAPEVMHGIGELPDGTILNWTAERIAPRGHPSDTSGIEHGGPALYPVLSPAMEYGIEEFPVQPEHLVIRNATIWTQGPEGVLEDADMLVSKGKIVRVGRGLQLPRQTIEIDGQGMHVTPGLIDAHIHTSISGGVNEVGNAITSEVRIRDVIDSKNIWIYRLLAGGLTSANLLHGSANPIGGQNAVLKMRWGALPSEMFIEDAPEGIKFALGENVKRSQNRYPNTRMGVEQIIRDEFHAAIDYRRAWRAWERDKSRISPRKDLRLEAIAEIIEGKRMIHAHCYRQDEILMLIRLMEEFDVRIRSFQHVVEGYKIAEALSEHGAGAAVWSDWWAFKVEAYDGTIYNARLLNDNGVLTVIHSDNTVIATRMNWEAGKTVGTGVSETDALNFVTLNPAKMLGIDHRVGSLEAGKDADFVIWNTNPLSPFSVAEQTWVDGRKYFDRELDARLQLEMQSRHAALIQKVLASKASGRSISGVGEKSESLNGSIYDEEYTCMEDHHEIH